jgi:hypothetical protein
MAKTYIHAAPSSILIESDLTFYINKGRPLNVGGDEFMYINLKECTDDGDVMLFEICLNKEQVKGFFELVQRVKVDFESGSK